MKKLLGFVILLTLLLFAASCGTDNKPEENEQGGGSTGGVIGGWTDPEGNETNNNGSGDNNSGNNGSGNNQQPTPTQPEGDMAIFNALFDETTHVSIKLDISDSELKKIQQDYDKYASMGSKSPIYRMADMVITLTTADGKTGSWTIPQVGVRMKGNTSRTSFYNDHEGMYNLIHFKISFKETFDEAEYYGSDALVWADSAARKARKNRTFATLEKMDIRWNRNDDTTYIRETYAYELYREFGVLAPHTNLASVDIGNDHAGVWVIYEPVDDLFLEKNLPAEALGGDLYKLGWTNEGATFTSFSSYGVEDEDKSKFYVYDLKTNKKTSTHESLKNLINTIKSSSVSKDKFASVVDTQNFMYYCAVSYMVGNCDDLRNNYNNSYIYFRADTGKMIVIPYDGDRGLGVNVWNPYGHGMTKDDPFTKYNVCGDQRSPLFLRSVCEGGFFVNEYIEALKAVDSSERLTNARFAESFNIAKELYSDEATPSRTYYNAENHKFRFDINRTCSASDSKNMSFADYLSAKRATLYSAIGDQGNTDTATPDTDSGNSGGSTDSGNTDSGNNTGGSGSGTTETGDKQIYLLVDNLNNWQATSDWQMTYEGNGFYSISFYNKNGMKLKVYDKTSNVWYVYSDVAESNVNYYDNDSAIYIDSGSYTISFNANTGAIHIKKQ